MIKCKQSTDWRIERSSKCHFDHLGSTSLVTNSAGNEEETIEYYPFGETLSSTSQDFTYESKELDGTNLQYFEARYKGKHHFTQPDTLLPNIYDPQQLNRYMFERGNPYVYNDYNGHEPVKSQATKGVESSDQILNYIISLEQGNPDWSSYETLNRMASDYFIYEEHIISDKSKNYFSPNFVYTESKGVLDMRHFFANADIASDLPILSRQLFFLEYVQELGQLIRSPHSFLTYEDLISNRAGRGFGRNLDPNEKLSTQLAKYFEENGVSEFPDSLWDSMPEKELVGKFPEISKMNLFGTGKSLPGDYNEDE